MYTIRRAENVNLDWLLTGEGKPFYVYTIADEKEFAEYVEVLLSDEPHWQVYICALAEQTILIFEQPGQWAYKDAKLIDIRTIEIIVGKGSEQLAKVLRDFPNRGNLKIPLLSDNDENTIVNGQAGTYLLFDSDNALLANHRQAKESDLQFYATTPNQQTDEPIQLNLMRAVITLVENCETELGESLTTDQKSRIITAVYRQAVRLGLAADELTSDVVETAFDVLRD
ncbi:transcriptional regulator [Vibrio sp. PP-XX7]